MITGEKKPEPELEGFAPDEPNSLPNAETIVNEDDDSQSLQTPSEGALQELIPQLSRRGTITIDSPYFSTEKFIRNVLTKAEEQGLKRGNAGVCFRSLIVHGYGSEFARQRTVGTVATGLLRIRDTIRQRRHPPMKTILDSMDGVVKEGE